MAIAMKNSYEQIKSRADDELQSLAQAKQEIGTKRQQTTGEIAAIQAQANSRNAQLAALRQELKALEDHHDRVGLELDLAQGSDLASPLKRTLSQLVAELQTKRQAIVDLEKGTFASSAKDAGQLQRLQSDLAGYEKHLAEIDTKRVAVQAARDQFLQAQGEAEAQAIKSRIAELGDLLAQAEQAAQETRAALLRFSDEARERLAPWPELQRQIRPLLAFENPTTRVIAASITLRDLLIEQGKQTDLDPALLRQMDIWESLVALLEMEKKDLWPAVNLNQNDKPQRLIEQREKLQRVLQTIRGR